MCATGIALLECFMLNCLSQKPVCEVNADDEKLLLSLLFKHLEDIPLENPQHMVIYFIYSSMGRSEIYPKIYFLPIATIR